MYGRLTYCNRLFRLSLMTDSKYLEALFIYCIGSQGAERLHTLGNRGRIQQ